MKVNIGCGEFYAPGWLNIDIHDQSPVRVDLLGDVTRGLELPDDCATHIYLGHVLEHLERPEGVSAALAEVARIARPGAEVMVVGPDVDRARAGGDLGVIHGAVHGAGRWANDVHHWECSEHALMEVLTEAGYDELEPIPITEVRRHGDWPLVADIYWQCAVKARAPVVVRTPS